MDDIKKSSKEFSKESEEIEKSSTRFLDLSSQDLSIYSRVHLAIDLESTQSSAQTPPPPSPYPHGYPLKSWKWSDDCDCYLHFMGAMRVPDAYCLGDRMIYTVFGQDSYGVFWEGIDKKGIVEEFSYDVRLALEWLQEAEYKEYGCRLWSSG